MFGSLILAAMMACGGGAPEAAPTEAPVASLPADGQRYEPAIDKEEAPEGAWICDMGTVHYARPDKGDGTCPVCGMELVHHEP